MKFFWSRPARDNEQQVDYSSYSKDQLLNSFKSDNWEKLSEDNKIAVLQEVENRNASEQGRPAATVVSANDANIYGSYTSTDNQIKINVSNFSSYEVLDTYVHESSHAYQSHCIETGEGYDDHTLSMMEAEMARDERGSLYNYATTSPEYDMQCDELDSNNKAASFMLEQRARYENDPSYRAYIEERANHFNQVNSSIENNPEDRARLQNNQAYLAYVRGDITEEQYTSLSDNINNENFQDTAATQSQKIGASLDALNKEYQNENEHAHGSDYMGNVQTNTESIDGVEYLGNTTEVTSSTSQDSYLGTAYSEGSSNSTSVSSENSVDKSSSMDD